MKTSILSLLHVVSLVSAHSWVEVSYLATTRHYLMQEKCVNHDNTQILRWMEGNATLSPPKVVDSRYTCLQNFAASI
jgi:hypothetical protein